MARQTSIQDFEFNFEQVTSDEFIEFISTGQTAIKLSGKPDPALEDASVFVGFNTTGDAVFIAVTNAGTESDPKYVADRVTVTMVEGTFLPNATPIKREPFLTTDEVSEWLDEYAG
jgi:hypothetical protein